MNTWKEKAIKTVLVGGASTSILVVFLIFLFLGKEAFPFISEPGLGALLASRWVPVSFQREIFGIIPLITGSAVVTLLATILLIPFGVLGAIYIAEIATPGERGFLNRLLKF